MKVIGLMLVLLLLPPAAFSQQLTEVLGRPTDNSITINALFDTLVEVYFEYGTTPGEYTCQTQSYTSVTDQPVEASLGGLTCATRYYYRTRYHKIGETTYLAGPVHTFITSRIPGSSFRFTIESDPHPYDKKGSHSLWDICLTNQLRDTADFMLDMGDTFGDDHEPFTITSAGVQRLQLNCRSYFSHVCHSLPLFFCLGNHEGESGYYLLQTPTDNLAMYETIWRKLYFPNPYPDDFYGGNSIIEGNSVGLAENYYAWEWGDALFVVLDVYRYADKSEKPQKWDFTIGKTQYDWFNETLETSNAKYKFVFAHHILGQGRGGIEIANGFEWGGYDGGRYTFAANRPGWDMPIHQLMVKNKVDIFFQGHDHIYVKQELDGIIYQTVQMPSDSTYLIGMTDNGDAFLSGKKLDGSGHLRVTVSPDSVYVEYISAVLPDDENDTLKNGQVRDAYSVIKSQLPTTVQDLKPDGNSSGLIFNVYPNPAKDYININLYDAPDKKLLVQMIALDGRIVKQFQQDISAGGQARLNITLKENGRIKITPGIYVLCLTSGSISVSRNIIIQ